MFLHNRIIGMTGVVPGGTATGSLPLNVRYMDLRFFCYRNNAPAPVEEIIDKVTLYVNGKTVRELSAPRIRRIAKFNKMPQVDNELAIYFAEYWQQTPDAVLRTAWDMVGEKSFTYEITLKEQAEETDIIRIDGVRTFDRGVTVGKDANGNAVRLKTIIAQGIITEQANEGQFDIPSLPVNTRLARVHLEAANDISHVDITADDLLFYDLKREQLARILADAQVDSTAFNFSLCFDLLGATDALIASKLLLRVTSPQAQAVNMLYEKILSKFEG